MAGIEESLHVILDKQIGRFFAAHHDLQPESGLYHRIVNEVERVLIMHTLKAVNYNKTKAAKILGFNRNTLYKKIQELNIPCSE